MALTASGIKNVIGLTSPVYLTANEAIEKGDLVSATGYKADGDNERPAKLVAGISCASGGTLVAYEKAVLDGTADTQAPYGGAAAGTLVYLSDVAGDFSETPSTTYAQPVGVELSATRVLLNPDEAGNIRNQGYVESTRIEVPSAGMFAQWFIKFASAGTGPMRGLWLSVQDRSAGSAEALSVWIDIHSTATSKASDYNKGIFVFFYWQADCYVNEAIRIDMYSKDKFAATNPATTDASAIAIYMDDMGNAVSNMAGLHISRTVVDVGTSIDCWIRLQGGGSTGTNLFYIQGSSVATYLFKFSTATVPVVLTAGTYSTADGYIQIQVASTAYRIPIFVGVN